LGTFVAFLRGINVGGKNKLPMKDLVAMFRRAGCSDVRHFIQSGNVLFEAKAASAERLPGIIETDIERRFPFRTSVILRSADEMAAIADGNPLLSSGSASESLHVMFLAHAPGDVERARLDPNRSPPDTFAVRGREIYLSCPNGVSRSKLTNAYFDSKLGTTSTSRNWRTVLKVVEMLGRA
jgi:uncharacterized protein (DUF1697 family)